MKLSRLPFRSQRVAQVCVEPKGTEQRDMVSATPVAADEAGHMHLEDVHKTRGVAQYPAPKGRYSPALYLSK